MQKAKLRHIGIACDDPEATAKFYVDVFGMEIIGRIAADHKHASGVYLTDGVMTVTTIKFKTVEYATPEFGLGNSGLHHIGFELASDPQTLSTDPEQAKKDAHARARAAIEANGGSYMWPGGRDHQKFHDLDGVILEVTANVFPTTAEVVASGHKLPEDVKR